MGLKTAPEDKFEHDIFNRELNDKTSIATFQEKSNNPVLNPSMMSKIVDPSSENQSQTLNSKSKDKDLNANDNDKSI